MTIGAWEIVGQNNRELPIAKTIGDAVRDLIRRRYASNAAKTIERDWGLDPKTAKNVVGMGHVSERTLTKAVRAEGWSLLLALGAELTGETFDQFEERRLSLIIAEAEFARQNIRNLSARRQTLEARTARALADLDRPTPDMGRGTPVGAGSADLERGPRSPRSRKA
jgi:hypothetical protein